MKTIGKKLGIVLITLAAAFVGCKKADDMPRPGVTYDSASDVFVDQTNSRTPWVITMFDIRRTDVEEKTNDISKFKGWIFYFHTNNNLYAKKDGETVTGKWTKSTGNMNEEIIKLDFGSQMPFNELNNTWTIAKKSQGYKLLHDKDDSDGMMGSVVFEVP
jgi:hypothetical protein